MFKKILLLFACGISCYAHAESLRDVLAYTYNNSWSINAERAALKATDEGVAIAKSGYRPQLAAVGSVGRTYNKNKYDYTPITDEKYLNPNSVGLQFKQPIFSGLSTVESVNAAQSQVQAGRQNLVNTEQAVLLDAIAVYMDTLRDKAVLDLRKNNEKVLKQHLESYQKRYKVGDLTRTDVAQAEARLSGATAHRISAEGNLKVSRANFFSVVGQEPQDLQDVKAVEVDLPTSLEQAIEMAMENNPQIKAARYAREAAEHTVKAQKGTLLPQVDVTAAAGRQNEQLSVDRSDYWQLHANLTVPLYQSGAEYANVRRAKQLENKYRILWDKTVQDVRSGVTAAWESYTASKAQVSSIEAQITASKMALDGVIREAKVGSRTVLDVLDAEQEHLDNQVSLVQTHRDEIVSAYTLLAAVGRLNPDDLQLGIDSYDPTAYYEEVKNKWLGYGID